jgi:hypothetical protein
VDEGGTGEFVVNVALEEYRRESAAAGEPLPHGDSEFDLPRGRDALNTKP